MLSLKDLQIKSSVCVSVFAHTWAEVVVLKHVTFEATAR